jgi:hypothetical protein
VIGSSFHYAGQLMEQSHSQTPDEDLDAFLDGLVCKYGGTRMEHAERIAESVYRVGLLR